jgi:hypothetical protein
MILGTLFLTLSSCESYIAFEKMRFNFFIYVFFGSLIIGLLGMLFSNRK